MFDGIALTVIPPSTEKGWASGGIHSTSSEASHPLSPGTASRKRLCLVSPIGSDYRACLRSAGCGCRHRLSLRIWRSAIAHRCAIQACDTLSCRYQRHLGCCTYLAGEARTDPVSFDPTSHDAASGAEVQSSSGPKIVEPAVDTATDLARCFLRLANLPNFALDRLSRYEATLWARPGRSCLLSMRWIVANPRKECAVSASAAGKILPIDGRNDY
jgi:hypothetical protein